MRNYFIQEAQALKVRLNQVKTFEQTMPMVAAANITKSAQRGIHQLLKSGVREVGQKIDQFIHWVSHGVKPVKAQRQFALLKLKFNAFLDQVDIFADVLTQRGEHETGIWIAGLDALATDALKLKTPFFRPPPLITYLDRGHGAAIRRARTRLPGGKTNPVAVIRVPRERMISSGIGASLIHEVGHQGSALLDLIPSLSQALSTQALRDPKSHMAWKLFGRWISEILSDFWAIAKLGVGATSGLMAVVSLPSYFVFRMNLDDPHPTPWIRVKISIGFGKVMFPDAQWERLDRYWDQFYDLEMVRVDDRKLLRAIEKAIPQFVRLLLKHRSKALKGKQLGAAFDQDLIQPLVLRRQFQKWKIAPKLMKKATPTQVFAVVGQAKVDQKITPARENEILRNMLSYWARKHAFNH